MFNSPAVQGAGFWLFYFGVGDIDAAAERVRIGGGKILEGPGDTPGGWIARCEDPQGAMFALMGPRFAKPVGYFERAEPSDPQSRRWSWRASNDGLSAS